MRIERTRFIPAGAIKVSAKDSDTIAYLFTTPRGNPAAVVYVGKGTKPYSHYSYRSEARREADLRAIFEGQAKRTQAKAERAAEKRAWVNPYKVGDLFNRSWGYDQTNVNWYEVTAVRGKALEVREIGQLRSDTGNMSGKCVPEPGRYIGEPQRCMAQPGRIKINHYAHAYFVAPTMVGGVKTYGAQYWSSYA